MRTIRRHILSNIHHNRVGQEAVVFGENSSFSKFQLPRAVFIVSKISWFFYAIDCEFQPV